MFVLNLLKYYFFSSLTLIISCNHYKLKLYGYIVYLKIKRCKMASTKYTLNAHTYFDYESCYMNKFLKDLFQPLVLRQETTHNT